MTERRVLGDVLLESGRVTRADIQRVLEHQRTHGGYFGEAAVALGLMKREEVDWALANQLDLPFIFPDAQSADPGAAALVSPGWALAHLAVPIVRAGRTVTVVVAEPLAGDTLADLRQRTGLEVEMALASAPRIRELIHALYGEAVDASATTASRGWREADPAEAAVELDAFLAGALADGADRIGVSGRGATARGWYTVGEGRERRRLSAGWEDALEAVVDPSPLSAARASPGVVPPFEATLRHGGRTFAVEARMATSPGGVEILLRPRRRAVSSPEGRSLPDAVRSDLRLLARDGDARVAVVGPAAELLPRLPELVLGDAVRAAHVTPQPDVPGVFVLHAEDDADLVALLDGYGFDALSTDLPLVDARLPDVLAGAPLAFAAVPEEADAGALEGAGLNWTLTVSPERDSPVWHLRPLKH